MSKIQRVGQFDGARGGVIVSRSRVWTERGLLLLLFAVAFVVRLWGVSRMHGWDENVYLQNAQLICCGKTNYNEIDSRPPVLSLLFAGTFVVWHSDYAAYVVTALLNALGPVLLYLAGKMFVGRRAAAIAALLMSFTPFFVSVFPRGFVSMVTGHGLLSDSPALTLILLGFWLLLRGIERDSEREFAAAGFILAMSVLMRFPSLASVGVLSLLALGAQRKWRAVAAVAAGFALGIAPYLGWSRVRYGGFLATFRSGWDNFSGPGQSALFYVKDAGVIFGWLTLAGLALWLVASGWELWRRRAERFRWRALPRSPEAFLWLWAVALLVCFSGLKHKEPRYAMPAAPPLLLLAGVGLSVLLQGRQRWLRVAGAGVLVWLLCWQFLPLRQRFTGGFVNHAVSEEMRVSEFLNANVAPKTVVYTNLRYPDFGYYTNLPIEVLPEDGWGLYKTLNNLPEGALVIAYKVFEGEAPEPAISWMDANPHYTRVHEFPTMVVYRFR
jgi:hypothetical protein